MANYAPIAGIVPQYDQVNYYLKFYKPTTTTPISMAINNLGADGTLLAKAQLDIHGFPTTDGTTIFIPRLNQLYDAYLFPTAAAADANDTVDAYRVAQNISPFANTPSVKDLATDYGARGNAVYQYETSGVVTVLSGNDDTQALLDAMADFASGAISALTAPDGNFWIDSSQIDCPIGMSLICAGSSATKFIMSTTNTSLNLFVGFYNGARVSNLHFSGFTVIGSKVDDNTVGGTGIFTFGTKGVTGGDLKSEGSKGLIWLGEDNVDGLKLFGTSDVFLSKLRVDDCKLFSVYVRGNETPNAAALPANDTNNINIDGLIIRGSNVGFVCAEGSPRNIKVLNYDCQDTDNLLQIEVSNDVTVSGHWSNATNQWNALAPAPFKNQWQITGSNQVTLSGYIDAECQVFGFGTNQEGCKDVTFSDVNTGSAFRVTTLNVQDGVDVNKNMFSNWKFNNCNFPRDGNTFFQSDVADQTSPSIGYWRDWSWSACTWENNSTANPITSVACVGSMVFDDKCVFNGKPPRSLKAQKITFDATVRANGIADSGIQFTAVRDTASEVLDQTILRIGANVQIEGNVNDIGYDVVHDNGSYDSRNQSVQCRESDALEFNNEGATFYRFTGAAGLTSEGIITYKELPTVVLPSPAGLNTFITGFTGNATARTITTGADSIANHSLVIGKNRDATSNWFFTDSLRGATETIYSDSASAEVIQAQGLTAFTSAGFSVGTTSSINVNTQDIISYTFVKREKFFDIVLDTGNATAKTIAHSLGADVGCILSKNRSISQDWAAYYHTLDVASGALLKLNSTAGVVNDASVWNSALATTTNFTVGNSALTNGNTNGIVHYLFAKSICHSYGGNGTTNNVVDFGYKPKLIIIKRATAGVTGNWIVYDNIRDTGDFSTRFRLNTNGAESAAGAIELTATGVILKAADTDFNAAGSSYILIAIPEI